MSTTREYKSQTPIIYGTDIKSVINNYKRSKSYFKRFMRRYSDGFNQLLIFYQTLPDRNGVLDLNQLCRLIKILSWMRRGNYNKVGDTFPTLIHYGLGTKTRLAFETFLNKFFDERVWQHLCLAVENCDLTPADLEAFYACREHPPSLISLTCALRDLQFAFTFHEYNRYTIPPTLKSLLLSNPLYASEIVYQAKHFCAPTSKRVPESVLINLIQHAPDKLEETCKKIRYIRDSIPPSIWDIISKTWMDNRESIDILFEAFQTILHQAFNYQDSFEWHGGRKIYNIEISEYYRNFIVVLFNNVDFAIEIAREFRDTSVLEADNPRRNNPQGFVNELQKREQQNRLKAKDIYNATTATIINQQLRALSNDLTGIVIGYATIQDVTLFGKQKRSQLLGVHFDECKNPSLNRHQFG